MEPHIGALYECVCAVQSSRVRPSGIMLKAQPLVTKTAPTAFAYAAISMSGGASVTPAASHVAHRSHRPPRLRASSATSTRIRNSRKRVAKPIGGRAWQRRTATPPCVRDAMQALGNRGNVALAQIARQNRLHGGEGKCRRLDAAPSCGLRWCRPSHGRISPNQRLSVAAETDRSGESLLLCFSETVNFSEC